MTSLIAWMGVDSRGPASMYLASDSRISWGLQSHWDVGRKLFASASSPDLFGYCGDVLFPSLFLGQVAHLLSLEAFVHMTAVARHDAVVRLAQESLLRYPTSQQKDFSILHATRETSGMQSQFRLWRTDSTSEGWSDEEVELPTVSVLALAVGTGTSVVSRYDSAWRRSAAGGTSRAVFSAFCDSIGSGDDPRSGGAPQLVAMYRQGSGETLGTLFNGSRYFLGLPVGVGEAARLRIEWRNELFERCGGESMIPLPGAQRHARPPRPQPPLPDLVEEP